jgi:mycothiol system anti-sigma-R factor
MEQQNPSNKNYGLTKEGSPYTEEECEEIITKLEAMLDGELDEEKQKEVEELVQNCEYCLEQYNVERSIRSMIRRGFDNISSSGTLVNNIKDKIKQFRDK